jgi:hypothetical protein
VRARPEARRVIPTLSQQKYSFIKRMQQFVRKTLLFLMEERGFSKQIFSADVIQNHNHRKKSF